MNMLNFRVSEEPKVMEPTIRVKKPAKIEAEVDECRIRPAEEVLPPQDIAPARSCERLYSTVQVEDSFFKGLGENHQLNMQRAKKERRVSRNNMGSP